MKKLIVLLAAAAMCACVQNATKNQAAELPDPAAPVALEINPETLTATFEGKLDSLTDARTYTIEARAGQKLCVELTVAEEPANVRINQIIAPSGAADGPFGKSIEYDITEDGTWSIIVAESLMVGEEYTGPFVISATLK